MKEIFKKKSVLVFMHSSRYSCKILMKLEFPRQVFEKKNRIPNFVKIRPVEAEVLYAHGLTDKREDRNEEANSRYSQFWRKRGKSRSFVHNFSFFIPKVYDVIFQNTVIFTIFFSVV